MNRKSKTLPTGIGIALCLVLPIAAQAGLKPIKLNNVYDHARYAPETDIKREFAAFTVSFDSKDDDDGDGKADIRRVPEWVAQHIKRTEGTCVDTSERPNIWATDMDLFRSGIAPNDASYKGSGFDRGHMAAKLLAARVGPNAEWNTHTVLNAIPQRPRFNRQIWRSLEDLTGAWAQSYGDIWVIQGPVFDKGASPFFIGDKGERPVAVPDALFKIVVRKKTMAERSTVPSTEKNDPEILVFLYPQLGPRYYGPKLNYAHERFLTTLEEVESLTGLAFFHKANAHGLSNDAQQRIRQKHVIDLWETPSAKNFLTGCRN